MNVKNKVMIVANCQGLAIKKILRAHADFNRDWHIYDLSPIHKIKLEEKLDIHKLLTELDLLIYQPISEKFGPFSSDTLLSECHAKCMSISFPVVYFTGYNPETIVLKPLPSEKIISNPHAYHDLNVLTGYINNTSLLGMKKRMLSSDFYSNEFIDENITTSLDNLKSREKLLDIKVSDYIRNNMFSEILMTSHNHPRNKILFYMVDAILKKINLRPLLQEEKEVFKIELTGQAELFRYPSLLNYLNLSSSSKIRMENTVMTLDTLIAKYYTFYRSNHELALFNYERFSKSKGIQQKLT